MSLATVRPLEPSDLGAVLEIEREAAPWTALWSPESYLPTPDLERRTWVVSRAGRIVGFVLARHGGGEMEILNLGVAHAERRTGVGRALVLAALAEGEARSAIAAFLEVRESNAGALAFYSALGFVHVGRRSNYYQDPAEDALVLTLPLPRRT